MDSNWNSKLNSWSIGRVWSMPIKIQAFIMMSINADHCRSIPFNSSWEEWIGNDWHWSVFPPMNFDRHSSALGNDPWSPVLSWKQNGYFMSVTYYGLIETFSFMRGGKSKHLLSWNQSNLHLTRAFAILSWPAHGMGYSIWDPEGGNWGKNFADPTCLNFFSSDTSPPSYLIFFFHPLHDFFLRPPQHIFSDSDFN